MGNASENETRAREGWVQMIGVKEATGALRETYETLRARGAQRPAVYETPSGDAPNIVKCHSLDPDGLRLAFDMSAAIHWGPLALPWAKREMLNTVTSAANDCFY